MEDLTTIKYHLKKSGGKLVGYARVSTDDQDCAIQVEKLNAIGCQKIYKDQKTGTTVERTTQTMFRLSARGRRFSLHKGRSTRQILKGSDHYSR